MIKLISFRMYNNSPSIERTRDLSSDDINILQTESIDKYDLWNDGNRMNIFGDSDDDDSISSMSQADRNPLLDSISDFTTSDSELYKSSISHEMIWDKVIPKKRHANYYSSTKSKLRKFPSLSTINPDNNSSSFEHFEDDLDDDSSLTDYDSVNSKSKFRGDLSVIKELNSPTPLHNSTEIGEYENQYEGNSCFNSNWKPIQTSTTTALNFNSGPISKNKPRTVMGTKRIPFTNYNGIHNFDDHYTPIIKNDGRRMMKPTVFKSEQFGLPSQCARQWGCKGILYLTIALSKNLIKVTVNKAIYFTDNNLDIASSYVRLELKQRNNYKVSGSRKHSIKGSSYQDKYLYGQETNSFRTKVISSSNKPEFRETFSFKVTSANIRNHDRIGISVYSTSHNDELRKKMIGCMAFPIKRLIKKASEESDFMFDQSSNGSYIVNDEGFILLGPTYGEKTNFPVNKIKVRTFYDDIGTSACSSSVGTSSIHSRSPLKMMNESEWRYGQQRHQMNIPQSTNNVTNYKSIISGSGRSMLNSNHNNEVINIGNEFVHSSSSMHHRQLNNIKSLGLGKGCDLNNDNDNNEYKRHYRFTLPSITTTTDSISDFTPTGDFVTPMAPLDLHYLYADSAMPTSNYDSRGNVEEGDSQKQIPSSSSSSSTSSLHNPNAVRRVSSFTVLPSKNKIKRNSADSNTKDGVILTHHDSKKNLNIVSKSINYVKHKMASALSFPILYPTINEVKLWETSFEALLHHKDGSELFKHFLKDEFSAENLDFWFECEEFKKMKEGKKSYNKALHIYELYIHEDGSKQVNLDADTRNTTKNMLDNGAKPDTFNLAQNRIEQLMSKDSYPRFLKSKRFLDFLHEVEHSDYLHNGKRNSTGDIS
uniref:RGS domain-containing protein n=1 Tax=Parastrongyloides trichosuri TaxID=131310 RepID=A0A0N4Z6L3_PARTI